MWDTQASAETGVETATPRAGSSLGVPVGTWGWVHVGGLGEPRAMEIMALLTVGSQPALADQAF